MPLILCYSFVKCSLQLLNVDMCFQFSLYFKDALSVFGSVNMARLHSFNISRMPKRVLKIGTYFIKM